MANRGIINSSVTGKALGSAVAEAENNYWNDQMKLLGYSYGTDKKGIAEDLSSTFTNTSPLARYDNVRDRKSRLKVSDGSIYCDQAYFFKFMD